MCGINLWLGSQVTGAQDYTRASVYILKGEQTMAEFKAVVELDVNDDLGAIKKDGLDALV